MTARYTPTAIALHWLIAVGIAGTFALGLYMHDLPLSPSKLELYSYHKWAGVTLFLLVLIRLLWRMGHPAPALPDTMPALMQKAAAAGHLALYVLMFAIPLSGWIMSSAKGFQTVWFGVIPLPDLVGKDKVLGHQLEELHELLSYTLLVLVIGHMAAALKHHWIDKDDVLTRMLPHHGTR
jgi:cytochrome b561